MNSLRFGTLYSAWGAKAYFGPSQYAGFIQELQKALPMGPSRIKNVNIFSGYNDFTGDYFVATGAKPYTDADPEVEKRMYQAAKASGMQHFQNVNDPEVNERLALLYADDVDTKARQPHTEKQALIDQFESKGAYATSMLSIPEAPKTVFWRALRSNDSGKFTIRGNGNTMVKVDDMAFHFGPDHVLKATSCPYMA
jgi:hypothetical protein